MRHLFSFLKRILRFSESTVNTISKKIEIGIQKETVFTIFFANIFLFLITCYADSEFETDCDSVIDLLTDSDSDILDDCDLSFEPESDSKNLYFTSLRILIK